MQMLQQQIKRHKLFELSKYMKILSHAATKEKC
jgi:hypothetical protein